MPTWEELQERAGKIIVQLLNEHESAPARSGYNRLLGKYTTSKRDVVKAAMANIKMVNEISQMLYGADVILFEEDSIPQMKANKKPK